MMAEPFGPYTLRSKLATGGMGEVFVAEDRQGEEGRDVVVKRILADRADDPDFLAYFRHEQHTLIKLTHPNIIRALGAGVIDKTPYIAMTLVEGPPLVRILSTALRHHKRLPVACAIFVGSQLARALAYVHDRRSECGAPLGLIHMDVAPHNVLVNAKGLPILIDFGIARSSQLPQPRNDFRGRTSYLSPEQIRGEAFDQRVDVFALGIIMHEMLVGRPLFRAADDKQTASRVIYGEIPPPHRVRPDCPRWLSDAVLTALSRRPERRHSRAADLVRLLEFHAPVVAHPVPNAPAARRAAKALASWCRSLSPERQHPAQPEIVAPQVLDVDIDEESTTQPISL